MKRLQIPLDERLGDALRRRALEEPASMAQVVHDVPAGAFNPVRPPNRTLAGFGFIGAGSSEPPAGGPVSVRHDEFLDEAIAARFPKP